MKGKNKVNKIKYNTIISRYMKTSQTNKIKLVEVQLIYIIIL